MRYVVGSDEPHPAHAAVVEALEAAGHAVRRTGAVATGAEVPRWVGPLAEGARLVSTGAADAAVLCCWSGTGASIVANKFPGVRAALCADPETAALARAWNDANVLVLANRTLDPASARAIVAAWLAPVDAPPGAVGGLADLRALDAAER